MSELTRVGDVLDYATANDGRLIASVESPDDVVVPVADIAWRDCDYPDHLDTDLDGTVLHWPDCEQPRTPVGVLFDPEWVRTQVKQELDWALDGIITPDKAELFHRIMALLTGGAE